MIMDNVERKYFLVTLFAEVSKSQGSFTLLRVSLDSKYS